MFSFNLKTLFYNSDVTFAYTFRIMASGDGSALTPPAAAICQRYLCYMLIMLIIILHLVNLRFVYLSLINISYFHF